MSITTIRQEIIEHPSNAGAISLGHSPIFAASPESRIVIVGQAPGKTAQDTQIPWNDISGDTLRLWLGVQKPDFYDASKFALLPMDFYYPGKGKSGDLPPRKDFAPMWHPRILAEMKDVRLTILIGQYAQRYYLRERGKPTLTQTVECYQEYLPTFLPLVHPSPLTMRWRSKNRWFEQDVVAKLRRIIGDLLG